MFVLVCLYKASNACRMKQLSSKWSNCTTNIPVRHCFHHRMDKTCSRLDPVWALEDCENRLVQIWWRFVQTANVQSLGHKNVPPPKKFIIYRTAGPISAPLVAIDNASKTIKIQRHRFALLYTKETVLTHQNVLKNFNVYFERDVPLFLYFIWAFAC